MRIRQAQQYPHTTANFKPGRKTFPQLAGGGGSAKGGASGHVATEDPDSLRSRSDAKFIDALSEGEIKGLKNGLKSIYFDGTPLQDADGSDNFKNYKIFILNGTQDQNYIPGFEEAVATSGIAIELKQATPWIRHITGPEVDAVRVNIRFPQLEKVNKKTGDVHGTNVEVKLSLKASGESIYTLIIDDKLVGEKTAGGYVRSYKIPMHGSAPWDLKVERVTPDSDSQTVRNQTIIDTFGEINEAKLRYPNTAIVASQFDAEFQSTIPVRTFHYEGILMQVPTNYDPATRLYAATGPGTTGGVWDGTFKTVYSNNAYWGWHEMVTNPRWGLGQFIDSTGLDKFAGYLIGQYSDGWNARPAGTTDDYTATGKHGVPDGQGGWEPRFTMNVLLQQFVPALKLLQDMASNFRAMFYYGGGIAVPVQDRPMLSIDGQFGPENVEGGRFVYSGSGRAARKNLITVAYNDATQLGELNYIQVEDEDDILLNGQKEEQTVAFGCYSPGQAWRWGQWRLLTNKLDGDTVTFKSGQDAAHLRPGMVVQTTDPTRSGKTLSGRISAINGGRTAITMETGKTITIEAGKTYQLCTLDKDGNIITKNITNAAGVASVLNVDVAWTTGNAPDVLTLWVLKVSDLQPELWRVISAVPNGPNSNDIIGVRYNDSKFAATDGTGVLEFPPTSNLPNVGAVHPPGAITFQDLPVNTPFGIRRNLKISWEPSDDPFLRSYQVSMRYEEGNWKVLDDSATGDMVLENLKAGNYEFRIVAINRIGRRSQESAAEYFVDTTNPLVPPDVSGLELFDQGNDTVFKQRDAKFQWRIVSATQASGFGADGLSGSTQDPVFQAYEVTIWNSTTQIWRELVQDPQFVFTFEKNLEGMRNVYGSNAKAINAFRIEVRVLDSFNNLSETPAQLDVSNPATGPVANPQVVATLQGVTVSFSPPDESDADYIDVLMSTDPFAEPVSVGRISAKASSGSLTGLNPTGDRIPRYFWLVCVDTFGNRSAAVQAPGSAVPGYMVGNVDLTQNGGDITAATTVFASVPGLPNAEIYYRHDATTPTIADSKYDPVAGISVSATGDLTVIGYLGGQYGPAETAHFILNAAGVQQPDFNPPGGSYSVTSTTKQINISTVASGASLSVTTDGSTPTTTNGTIFSSTSANITLPIGHTTVKAIAFVGSTLSQVASADFMIAQAGSSTKVATPDINPGEGTYEQNTDFSVINATPGASSRYTTDGTQPTSGPAGHGTLYSGNIHLAGALGNSRDYDLKIISWKTGLTDSGIAEFFITIDRTI